MDLRQGIDRDFINTPDFRRFGVGFFGALHCLKEVSKGFADDDL